MMLFVISSIVPKLEISHKIEMDFILSGLLSE